MTVGEIAKCLTIFAWLGCSVWVGVQARRQGRSGLGWFLLANSLISPLLAWLLLWRFRNNDLQRIAGKDDLEGKEEKWS